MDEYIGQQHAPLRSNLAPKGTNDELVEDFFNRLPTILLLFNILQKTVQSVEKDLYG